ncbi:MAG: VWA domain-containing protein [Pseudomonadota bacterium]
MMLPRAARPLVTFPHLLRANGFAVSPDQTMGFVEAVGLLGPGDIGDVRRAARAMLAIPPDRRDAFEALFDAHFLGAVLPQAVPDDQDEAEAHEATGRQEEVGVETSDDPGEEATTVERLGYRDLMDSPDAANAVLLRHGRSRLPRRRSRRYGAARQGHVLDLRRALREAVRREGEVLTLPRRRRRHRQRKIVLLIDISGSMSDRTDNALRLAHALGRVAERLEVFTLGTRLTRVTPALRHANAVQALERASRLIADIDGGTRIGEALAAFLAVPRYAGFARGAFVVVLSDGLERGAPDQLTAAMRRLGRLAWRIDWLSPLIPDGVPQTEAMRAILPELDHLGDGSTSRAIVSHLVRMSEAA